MPPRVAVTLASEDRPRMPVPNSSKKTCESIPASIGIEAQLFASQWNTGTDVSVWVAIERRMAMAAGTPVPAPLAVNRPGATTATSTVVDGGVLSPFRIVSVAMPGATLSGTMKLIWFGAT